MNHSRIVNVTVALCAVGVLSAVGGAASATPSGISTPAAAAATAKTAEPTPAVRLASVSRDNAAEMAASYLDYTAFSRTGLIKQLQFEGFSRSDATYGADSTHANWFKQAALMAQAYLDYSSFSRTGLIEQLKYEGFTTSQATYGAKAVGY